MEKVYRKPAVKTSSMYLFNLVNSPKQPTHVWDFWKQVIFKRDHEKGDLIFSFAPSHFLWTKFTLSAKDNVKSVKQGFKDLKDLFIGTNTR